MTVFIARKHETDDRKHGDTKVSLEFPRCDQAPNVVRTQLRIVIISAERNCDGARNGYNNTEEVTFPKVLFEKERRNDAV